MKMKAGVLTVCGAPRPSPNQSLFTSSKSISIRPARAKCWSRWVAPGSATPTCRSSTVIGRARCRSCWATRARANRRVGAGVHDVKVGDHVCFTAFNVSCGRCRRCLEGRPYICERSITPRAAGQLLSGNHRLHMDGKPVHHQSGVSCYAEYAVVDRGSIVVIDKTLPLDVAALFGCAVVTGVGAVAEHRPDPARQLGGRRGPGRRRFERPDGRGAGGRRPHRRHRPFRRQARPRAPARRHRHGERQGRRPCEAGARPHQRRRRLCVRSCRHHQGDGDGLSGDALGRHDGDRGPLADRRRFSFKQSALVSEEKTIKGSYMGSCVPVRDIPRFIALYQQGKLPVDRMVSERIGFDGLNVGFDRLQDVATVRHILVPHG